MVHLYIKVKNLLIMKEVGVMIIKKNGLVWLAKQFGLLLIKAID